MEKYRLRRGENTDRGVERYRVGSGEIHIEEWRQTDCGVERYRLRSGEIQTEKRRDTG